MLRLVDRWCLKGHVWKKAKGIPGKVLVPIVVWCGQYLKPV